MKHQNLSARTAVALVVALLFAIAIPASAQDSLSAIAPKTGTLEKKRDSSGEWEYSLVDEASGTRYRVTTRRDLSAYTGKRVEYQAATRGQAPRLKVLDKSASGTERAAASKPAASSDERRQAARSKPAPVKPAQYEVIQPGEEIVEGVIEGDVIDGGVIEAGPPLLDESPYGEGYYNWGVPHQVWVQGEYLLWWTRSMNTPALVSTSPNGTPQAQAGVLGQPGTSVLFGGNILGDVRSGVRLKAGTWLDSYQYWAIEGDLLGLEDATDSFARSSNGSPILARPFFNGLTGLEDSELVAFPGVVNGTVTVDADTSLTGAGIRLRLNTMCETDASRVFRFDVIGGYRHMRLDDNLRISEDLVSANSQVPASFRIQDHFATENNFHGGELGGILEVQRDGWTVELLAKIAFGNSHEVVIIDGNTLITTAGVPVAHPGGLLAQRTNMGQFEKDDFAVIPEFGLTAGYQLSPRLRATVGYTFIYWSHVARAGDQIDRVVNPNLLPPETVPFTGPLRPQFAFNDTDYWAQGLNFGLHYLW